MQPPSNPGSTALFVALSGHLRQHGGGVQICSWEYFKALQRAGFLLRVVEVELDRSVWRRVKRRLSLNLYGNLLDEKQAAEQLESACETPVQYVFLNQRCLAPLLTSARSILAPNGQVVLLSHGLESVDYLHRLRTRRERPFHGTSRAEKVALAQMLMEESQQAVQLDHVFCLSAFEADIERWLGARRVTVIPRTITTATLNWQPNPDRMGFVAQIDHPPNREGLVLFLEALSAVARPGIRLRVVGGPTTAGEEIARHFPIMDFLGRLSDVELQEEARTWSCFVHPLFCYARGCSTKLAVALGWEIPIATTPQGCRGYEWREGHLPMAESPSGLAKLALEILDPARAQCVQQEVLRIRRSSPTIDQVADLIRSVLSRTSLHPAESTARPISLGAVPVEEQVDPSISPCCRTDT